ncbi:peptide-methionine (S)-S-oxide reductase MsrA [Marinimicrococcus flavescens]|uniref:Peptide methionine sulfoxide reductase MsrA n=1 Tax=Marinimicrococcus flavescens TaxID=3031815 RepID=A0AAP3UZE1_9PROT|nr:peptide-methionine (S)-S-oxide reductase MsrA [Marinimicrococcus flavescens]
MIRIFLTTAAGIVLVAAAAQPARAADAPDGLATATFASGCFWCTEKDFEDVEGVAEAISGYTGGEVAKPSYEQVTFGDTGHVEAVQVRYDPEVVSYSELLEVYWRNVDFLDAGGQFCDRGPSYASAIFWHDAAQRDAALVDRERIAASGVFDRPVVTKIEEAGVFWPAEDYHQDYYKKNPFRYQAYRWNCGREARLDELRAGLARLATGS